MRYEDFNVGKLRVQKDPEGQTATPIEAIFQLTATLDPASVNANTASEEEFTVTGVKAGDHIVVDPPYGISNGVAVVGAYVSADDKVKVIFTNPTSGSGDPASGDYKFLVFRPGS